MSSRRSLDAQPKVYEGAAFSEAPTRLAGENDELLRELQLYKSVSIPTNAKPRSTMTRVARAPLTNHNMNARSTTVFAKSTSKMPGSAGSVRDELVESRDGDMTIDEIL